MSLAVLSVLIVFALLLSSFFDGLPALLWSWIYLPKWLLGTALISLVAWCTGSESTVE
jgi:hypothetical protein